MSTAAFATSCDPQMSADHLRLAEWVIIGTATKAEQIDSDVGSIAFTLEDVDRVRGHSPDQLELITSRFAYNPRIVIGDRYIVFTSPGSNYVDFCTGFANSDGIELFSVMLLREYGDCGRAEDRQAALFHATKEFLEQEWTFTSQMIMELLEVFRQRNPELRVQSTSNQIVVKGFQFKFSNELLVGLELVDCDA